MAPVEVLAGPVLVSALVPAASSGRSADAGRMPAVSGGPSEAESAVERGDLAEALLPVAALLTVLVHGDGGPEDVRGVLDGLEERGRTAVLVVLAGLVCPDRPLVLPTAWPYSGRALLAVAASLVMLVHDGGSPDAVHQVVGGLGAGRCRELTVVLAGLVDPDGKLRETLGWLDFDESRQVVVPPWDDQRTVRDLAETARADGVWGPGMAAIDEVAVLAYLAGRDVRVSAAERLAAVRAGARRGVTYLAFDRMHGLADGTTGKWMLRVDGPRRERRPGERTRFTDAEVVAIRTAAAAGRRQTDLAMTYGTTRQAISRIVNGVSYREAAGPICAQQPSAVYDQPRAGQPAARTCPSWAGCRPGRVRNPTV